MTHTHQPPASMESLKQPFAPSENATLGGTCRNCKRLRAALTRVTTTYDAYRRRGVVPSPVEYADVIVAIEMARAALKETP